MQGSPLPLPDLSCWVFVEVLLWLCNGSSIHEYRKNTGEQVMPLMRRQHAFIWKRKTVRVRVEGISDLDMLRSVLARLYAAQ
jgi:hypothetical protein